MSTNITVATLRSPLGAPPPDCVGILPSIGSPWLTTSIQSLAGGGYRADMRPTCPRPDLEILFAPHMLPIRTSNSIVKHSM